MARHFVVILIVALPATADEMSITASRDSTLYESNSEQLANGAGDFLYTGRTGQPRNRRFLVYFDLSEIPSDAAITSATLEMTVSKLANERTYDVSVYRALEDWGEGDSDASVSNPGGQGIEALDGDATWAHRFLPDTLWENPGGDYVTESSDTVSTTFDQSYTWGQEGQLINDVQHWIDFPDSNHGWIVIGDESEPHTARQFNSRTHLELETRPTLTVRFDAGPPLMGDCNGDGVLNESDLSCVCAAGDDVVSTLEAMNLVVGDLDLDGEVGFPDFLLFTDNYGKPGDFRDGDFDCNGRIGFQDVLILSQNYGKRSSAARAAPEACTSRLAMFGFALVQLGCRRQQRKAISI